MEQPMSGDLFNNLPLELLSTIFGFLDLITRHRVPAVCRGWRDAAIQTPLPSSEQLWAIAHGDPHGKRHTRIKVVDFPPSYPSSAMVLHRLQLTPAGKDYLSPFILGCYGHILILNRCLFDPFSRKSVPLPVNNKSSYFKLQQAKLSCPPTQPNILAGACIVAVLHHSPYSDSCIDLHCIGHSDNWMTFPAIAKISDLAFFNGALYVVTSSNGTIFSTHLSKEGLKNNDILFFKLAQAPYDSENLAPPRDLKLSRYHQPKDYLVESCGDLLLVRGGFRLPQEGHPGGWQISFKVYKLEGNELVRINDLGDRMLFVGKRSMSRQCASPASAGFFTKNCIYFFWVDSSIGRFHLDGNQCNAYLHTSLVVEDSPFHDPLWMAPSFSTMFDLGCIPPKEVPAPAPAPSQAPTNVESSGTVKPRKATSTLGKFLKYTKRWF